MKICNVHYLFRYMQQIIPKRSAMMPVNNLYSIEELMEACKYYIAKTNKRISFEYALAKR